MARLSLALLLSATAACRGGDPPAETLTPAIDAARLEGHIGVLASDRFEGRAPGGRGEELTVAYLVDQFRQAGLQPGNPDGTFIQRVPLVGITPEGSVSLTFRRGGQRRTLRYPDDFVAWTKRVADRVSLEESELAAHVPVGGDEVELLACGAGAQHRQRHRVCRQAGRIQPAGAGRLDQYDLPLAAGRGAGRLGSGRAGRGSGGGGGWEWAGGPGYPTVQSSARSSTSPPRSQSSCTSSCGEW